MHLPFHDESVCTLPMWESTVTYGESGMFIGEEAEFALLFPPRKILSVTSSDLKETYREGVDYIVTPEGRIRRVAGGNTPFISEADYYADNPEWYLVTKYQGRDVHTYWGENNSMSKLQICVTYTHAMPTDAPVPTDYSCRYETFLNKLKNGEDVTVLFLGDSITAGASSSYQCDRPPYMYPWTIMSVHELARRFGYRVHHVQTGLDKVGKCPEEDAVYGDRGTITYINTAVGGWRLKTGILNYEERVSKQVKKYGCDLFVLAFGMNDKTVTTEEEMADFRKLLDRFTEECPTSAVLTVATMLPNPEANERWNTVQHTYEAAMLPMAEDYYRRGIPCSVVPMTTMSRWILSHKRFCDISGNNINHPNDFIVRLYAATLLQTLTGKASETQE